MRGMIRFVADLATMSCVEAMGLTNSLVIQVPIDSLEMQGMSRVIFSDNACLAEMVSITSMLSLTRRN